MFFATWLSEIADLKSELTGLNAYAAAARAGLPPLAAVDETVTEPSRRSAADLPGQPRHPLDYPVGLDTTGRVADGYGVQDQPWFTRSPRSGQDRLVARRLAAGVAAGRERGQALLISGPRRSARRSAQRRADRLFHRTKHRDQLVGPDQVQHPGHRVLRPGQHQLPAVPTHHDPDVQ